MDWPAYLVACAAQRLMPGAGTLSVLGAPTQLLGPRWRPWLATGFVILACRLLAG